MNKPLAVGITGGIGAGKTLAATIFKLLGIPVYNADNRAKQLMHTLLKPKIIALFGAQSFTNGQLNRNYLAKKVFNHPNELARLNNLVHPAVANDYKQWHAQQTQAPYTLKEAALLVENSSYKQLDKLIVVTAPNTLRVKRIKERDPFRTTQEIEKIMANQMPEAEKKALADFTIKNNEQELLIPQVLAIDIELKKSIA